MQFQNFTESELEALSQTLAKTIAYAQQTLEAIDDHLWSRVCRGSPTDWDQLQTAQQEK